MESFLQTTSAICDLFDIHYTAVYVNSWRPGLALLGAILKISSNFLSWGPEYCIPESNWIKHFRKKWDARRSVRLTSHQQKAISLYFILSGMWCSLDIFVGEPWADHELAKAMLNVWWSLPVGRLHWASWTRYWIARAWGGKEITKQVLSS